jgi:hypothetical protein
VDRLAAAAAHVVFVPAVAIELVLLARVPESCIGSVPAVAVLLTSGVSVLPLLAPPWRVLLLLLLYSLFCTFW